MALSNGQVALNAADVPANDDSNIQVTKSGSDIPTEVLDPVSENNNPQTPDKLEMQRLIQLTREKILAQIEQDPSMYNPGKN